MVPTTRLRKEEAKKKKLNEEKYVLDQLGQESDKKANPLVKEVMGEKEKQEKERNDRVMELMMGASRGKKGAYIAFLAELLTRRLVEVEWPFGWRYEVFPTEIGVVLEIVSVGGRIFRAAFKPTGEAIYDLNAIDLYGNRAQHTIDTVTNPITKSLAHRHLK